jgi:hypothetical protein
MTERAFLDLCIAHVLAGERRLREREMIDKYIAEHGVTKCPAAMVAKTQAELSPEDMAEHKRRGSDPFGDIWRNEPQVKHMARASKISAAKRRLAKVLR